MTVPVLMRFCVVSSRMIVALLALALCLIVALLALALCRTHSR